jgi:hypothetical protein
MYDSDHPVKQAKTSKLLPPAGYNGMMRVARMLLGAQKPPKEVNYLCWGESGYSEDLPSGYDVRDALAGSSLEGPPNALGRRINALGGLLERITLLTPERTSSDAGASKTNGAKKRPTAEIGCQDCSSYAILINSWRKAMKWTDGLDHALACMLASVASTKSVGDQLWMKVIGPAACGKSTLCEALSVNKKYIKATSTVRGFHSGYRDEGSEGEDCSLVSLLRGKTLVTKDGDTLLQAPNLGQILSEARDIYDRTSRTHYRNNMGKDYEGLDMTWLLCGTSSLRAIDSSELGERFLDCVIMEGIDDELEDAILLRVANKADSNMGIATDGENITHVEPELSEAMSLTGGYVSWLRENATDTLSTIDLPDDAKRKLTRLGKFVAHMRARPSTRQEETAERELASRLVSQLVRLAKCLALVLNQKHVNAIVMKRVKQVAMDTSRGQSLALCSHLRASEGGLDIRTLALYTNYTEDQVRKMLRFLRLIYVVEAFTPDAAKGIKGKPRWRLTDRMRRLYDDATRAGED